MFYVIRIKDPIKYNLEETAHKTLLSKIYPFQKFYYGLYNMYYHFYRYIGGCGRAFKNLPRRI